MQSQQQEQVERNDATETHGLKEFGEIVSVLFDGAIEMDGVLFGSTIKTINDYLPILPELKRPVPTTISTTFTSDRALYARLYERSPFPVVKYSKPTFKQKRKAVKKRQADSRKRNRK